MSSSSATLLLDDYLLALAQTRIAEMPQAEFVGLTERLQVDPALIERNVAFRSDAYARNFVCRTPQFELLVLCWEPGHVTTVHDHGGSLNFIRVHRGRLTSRLFERVDGGGLALASEETLVPAGSTSVDRPQIHQLANTSGARLVTVHVYAPALTRLTVYDVETGSSEQLPLRYTVADDLAREPSVVAEGPPHPFPVHGCGRGPVRRKLL
jgi:cysteine dioxygenase